MTAWLHVPCDWRRPEVAGGHDLFWSTAARFGQLYPRPTVDEVAAFYRTDYYTHSETRAAARERPVGLFQRLRERLAWCVDHGTDLTAQLLGRLAVGRCRPAVLEFGCGGGALLADLHAAGWTAVGVEPDPSARAMALGRELEVHDGTAEDLPPALRGREFDVIVMQHVLEHCLDPLGALRSAQSVLRPGGFVVVETPNNEAASCAVAGAAWPWLDVPRHLNFFTTRSLRLACEAVRLTVTATEFTGYIRQFQRPWLEMEQQIRSAFRAAGAPAQVPSLGRGVWLRLLHTAFADPRSKYDSVRIVARSQTR
jgi:SAM-dependent methyltransferase